MFLKKTINDITFNEIDGRVVVHYLEIVSTKYNGAGYRDGSGDYALALKIAKKFGGRKFHNKQFGGGIAFYASFNSKSDLDFLVNQINSNKVIFTVPEAVD